MPLLMLYLHNLRFHLTIKQGVSLFYNQNYPLIYKCWSLGMWQWLESLMSTFLWWANANCRHWLWYVLVCPYFSYISPPGEPVLGPSKARPLSAVRTEPGGLEVHGAGFSSGSESRDQLSFSSSRRTQHSSEYSHPTHYLTLCYMIFKSMNLFTLSCLSHTALLIYCSTIK